MDKQRDRHAPGALTGDTPVRALLKHGFDTVLAPTRNPADALDGFQGIGAQVELVHADEPLGGGPVDQRGLRSEEHTSELQSRPHLVCRLLLEKKKKNSPRQRPVTEGLKMTV